MFKFLRDKLKEGISKFSKKVEEEGREELREEEKKEELVEEKAAEIPKEEKKSFFRALKERFQKKKPESTGLFEEALAQKEEKPEFVPVAEKKPEEPAKDAFSDEEIVEKEEIRARIPKKEETRIVQKAPGKEAEAEPEKKGFFRTITEKIITKKIDAAQFEDLFWNLEVVLLENNVAVEVVDKIKVDLKETLVDKPIKRDRVEETIEKALKQSLERLFEVPSINIPESARKKKPYVICFMGINGSGKTTTIAKIAKWLKEKGFSVVLAAADTFRAASIEQLQYHADKLGVKLVKHDYHADPAAVAFDAIKHAKSKRVDVVLIDTAGRIHSNVSLLDEMKKIIRVAQPDLKLFVGESITGNDCTEQAKRFNEAVGIDAIVLAKADIDEKGGAAISISYVTQKPIIFIGTGQGYDDLKEFDPKIVIDSLGLEA